MYSGGRGYFKTALASPKFALQQGASYFALRNTEWLIVGLDTAYDAGGFMYNTGELKEPQLSFLRDVVHSNLRADGTRRKLLLLSHHQPVEYDGSTTPLWDAVAGALTDGPDFWYWGHVHSTAAFVPKAMGARVVAGRCCGHGGIPYLPDSLTPALEWTESGLAHDPEPELVARAMNGFVQVALNGVSLIEIFWGEDGSIRWTKSWSA
jgi:hypothetical protein